MTIAGKNEIYNRENLVRPFLVHQVLGSKTPSPPPPPCSKEALEGGVGGRVVLEERKAGGFEGGLAGAPPPPMVPLTQAPEKNFKAKSS